MLNVGMTIVILLLFVGSAKSLKIEDKEGNALYNGTMESKDQELVKVDQRVSDLLGRALWTLATILG